MSRLQTKALMVANVGGVNYRVVPCKLYSWFGKHAVTRRNFPFCKVKLPFDDLLNVYQTDVWYVRCIKVEEINWKRFASPPRALPITVFSLPCDFTRQAGSPTFILHSSY